MYEVEVKVSADHDAVHAALADGAVGGETPEAAGTVAQADTYFDAPHREFAETDEAFRVRRVATATPGFERRGELGTDIDRVLAGNATASSESRVTYKGPLVEAESKTREEFETTVGDGDEMRDIVTRLGFDAAATVRKLRTRYAVGDLTVLLDAVEGVGEYVEVETEVGTEAEVEAARERAYAVLRDLGLDPDDQIRTSYLGLKLGVDEHPGDA
jgi:adenylate cyclase class 2